MLKQAIDLATKCIYNSASWEEISSALSQLEKDLETEIPNPTQQTRVEALTNELLLRIELIEAHNKIYVSIKSCHQQLVSLNKGIARAQERFIGMSAEEILNWRYGDSWRQLENLNG